MPLRFRLLISALIGLAVFAISCEVGYRLYFSCVGYTESLTLRDIGKAGKAIGAYRQEHGALPETLLPVASSFGRRNGEGMPLDWWYQPLHYSTDGTHYRITSYGADGKPGGVGLDYDLSSDDLPRGGLSEGRSGLGVLPPQARPTFWQFMTYHSHASASDPYSNRDSGSMMFLMSVLAGVAAFALSTREVGKSVSEREAPLPRWFRLLLVIGATLFVALAMIALDAPQGH